MTASDHTSDRPLRIAQIAPLFESVPPRLYGGTERVVSYITEELVRQGHDVTLFASGDSQTSATLVPYGRRALRLGGRTHDPFAAHLLHLERVFREAHTFDILHFHCDYLSFPFSRRSAVPHVTTLHGRLDIPMLGAIYDEYRDMPVISISNAQRRPIPQAAWQGTVYHGLPDQTWSEAETTGAGGYLAFLGRISPEKGVERAIEIARGSGVSLRIAAKVDKADREYHERYVEPLLRDPGVEFIGEISEADKTPFLNGAVGLLFPIDWPEPFGLVMIEAMARGVPVIAFPRGSVPEVVDDGVTGFIVEGVDEAIAAVARLEELPRAGVRRRFEERYTAERMTRDYVALYRSLIAGRRKPSVPSETWTS